MSWHEEEYDSRYYRYPPPPPSPPRRYPSPRQHHHHYPHRYSGAHLSPDPPFESSLHRSRSQGHGPRPEINIYNYQDKVAEQRSPGPIPGAFYPPPSPNLRGRTENRAGGLAEELLAAELAEMRLDRLARSRSRGKSDAPIYQQPSRAHSPNYYKWQLEQKEKELREAETKKYWEKEQERMRIEFELKQAKADEKRKRENETAEEERKRIIAEHDRLLADRAAAAKEEERRVLKKLEQDKIAAKEEERRVLEKIARDKKAAEEAEERAWREFEQKQKEKREAAEAKEKAEKEKIDTEMRNRLLKAGYSLAQIEAMLDPKKAKKDKSKGGADDIIAIVDGGATSTDLVFAPTHHVPVYAKIHKKYLDVQTLRYYQIPYEFDRANSDYIIILQEMDKEETDLLFEHTRRLRKGKLLLEPKKEKREKEFAWVRKRDRSKSVGRRDVRVIEVRK